MSGSFFLSLNLRRTHKAQFTTSLQVGGLCEPNHNGPGVAASVLQSLGQDVGAHVVKRCMPVDAETNTGEGSHSGALRKRSASQATTTSSSFPHGDPGCRSGQHWPAPTTTTKRCSDHFNKEDAKRAQSSTWTQSGLKCGFPEYRVPQLSRRCVCGRNWTRSKRERNSKISCERR